MPAHPCLRRQHVRLALSMPLGVYPCPAPVPRTRARLWHPTRPLASGMADRPRRSTWTTHIWGGLPLLIYRPISHIDHLVCCFGTFLELVLKVWLVSFNYRVLVKWKYNCLCLFHVFIDVCRFVEKHLMSTTTVILCVSISGPRQSREWLRRHPRMDKTRRDKNGLLNTSLFEDICPKSCPYLCLIITIYNARRVMNKLKTP